MSTLLHIDSSPLYGRSVSRELTAAFVTQWKASHPDGRVIERDLNATAIPPVNAEWVGAVYTPEQARTPSRRNCLSSPTPCSPNWSRPMSTSSERRCITLACLPRSSYGSTRLRASGGPFRTGRKGRKGLITGKKVTFIIATGGIYDAQTQMASFNFVEPYLRSVFGFLGVTDATFLTAGGTAVLNQGQDRNAFLAPHLQAVQTHAQTSQGDHA